MRITVAVEELPFNGLVWRIMTDGQKVAYLFDVCDSAGFRYYRQILAEVDACYEHKINLLLPVIFAVLYSSIKLAGASPESLEIYQRAALQALIRSL